MPCPCACPCSHPREGVGLYSQAWQGERTNASLEWFLAAMERGRGCRPCTEGREAQSAVTVRCPAVALCRKQYLPILPKSPASLIEPSASHWRGALVTPTLR